MTALFSLRRVAGVLCASLALCSCSSTPPPPDWQINGREALQAALQADLSGKAKVADLEFARAHGEIAKTGRLDLLARVTLARCAVKQASLEKRGCPAFATLQNDAAEAERAYARFLAGTSSAPDAQLLPEQYRPLLANQGDVNLMLAAMADPTSRLIAASVLFYDKRLSPAGITLAVETAAQQGWSKALMAWLQVQVSYLQQAGQAEDAARAQRRLDLVSGRTKP